MNHHKKEIKLKKALKLVEELNLIYSARRVLPQIKLDQPIRQGWKRYYVVRKEYWSRNDIKQLRGLIERLNQTCYSRNRAFKEKETGSKKLVGCQQHMRTIDQKQYLALPPQIQRLFEGCSDCKQRRAALGSAFSLHYHFVRLSLLELRVKPHFLTHYTPIDGELMSRQERIYNRMRTEQLWTVLNHHSGAGRHRDIKDVNKDRSGLTADQSDQLTDLEVERAEADDRLMVGE